MADANKTDFEETIFQLFKITVPAYYQLGCNQNNSFEFRTISEVNAFKLGFNEGVNRA